MAVPTPAAVPTRPPDRPLRTSGRPLRPSFRRFVFLVAALAFFGIGLHQASRDAPTVDEGVDVSSGVSALVKRDLRMVPEHPVLPRALAALPALAAHPIVPETEAWEQGDWFDWSDDFVSANAEAGRLDDILLYARAVVLVEVIACALLISALTARWFGPDGGLLAGVAWLATPYLVGIGHFALIDVPFTVAALGVALLVARWRERPTMGRLIALAVALGASLASRHTALVLVAFAVVLVAEHHRRDYRSSARDVGILGIGSVLVLWLVYRGLAPGGSPGPITGSFEGLISDVGSGSAGVKLIGSLPLPVEWRAGFAYLDLTSTARPSSLLGRSWDGGAWWFFPVSALLKVPAGILLGIVGGWAVAAKRAQGKRDLLRFVVAPGVLLWLFLVAQPLNLGLRLALPSLAFAYVGLGVLPSLVGEDMRSPRHRVGVAAIAMVAIAGLASTIAAVPHSLAWTPWPWTPSYQWVSDSSIDAGQALYEVRDWAEDHDEPYVAIDTTRGLEVGGGSRSLTQVEPTEVRGWVAVGITPLMQTRRDASVWPDPGSDPPPGFSLAWLRKYCPVGTLGGGSVLLYRFEDAPDPAPGPERPVGPCLGDDESTAP